MSASCIRIIKVLLLSLIFQPLLAQKSEAIVLELGGSAGLASINYERSFVQREGFSWGWRVGLSGFYIDRNAGFVGIFPFALQTRIGKANHQFEAAMGFNLSLTTKGSFHTQAIPSLGYRFQRPDSRWFYKIAYTPLISFLLDWQYQHWMGISIAYSL